MITPRKFHNKTTLVLRGLGAASGGGGGTPPPLQGVWTPVTPTNTTWTPVS